MGLSCVHRNGAPVLHFGAQQPPVEDVRLCAIEGSRHVDFPQVDPGDRARRERAIHRRFGVGGDGFVLAASPVDDYRLRQLPVSGQNQRGGLLPIGETQVSVCQVHGGLLVLDTEVPFALVWGFALGSSLRRSRQLLREAKKASTQASDVWACRVCEVKSRLRCVSLSQMPLCRTVRQKKTSAWV